MTASDTPRTDEREEILSPGMIVNSRSEVVPADFARTLERELATVKDALASEKMLTHDCVKLDQQLATARNEMARLNGQTRWQCACGGTDCEGQRENERLRAQLATPDPATKEKGL
jgi:hypothetical protein